jgi:hypothetical protein
MVHVFRSWCVLLAPEQVDAARAMMISLAQVAKEGPASVMQSHNLGGESLEALTFIAGRRPEWRQGACAEVATAILEKLTNRAYWNAHSVAIETAIAFADAFSPDQLRGLVDSVLDLTDQMPTKSQHWLLLRAALTLLISSPVKLLAALEESIGRRIVTTILRFGEIDAVESPRMLFYLHDFNPKLLNDESLASRLANNVADLRRRARQTNSSNVSANILALLLVPAISGREGVKDAIDSLGQVVNIAIAPRSVSIGLQSAYQVLMRLANHQSQIASDLALDISEFKMWVQPLLPLIIALWQRAQAHAAIFATFSLPPNERPNSVVVHNWAYASLAFAGTLDAADDMNRALNQAATNPLLSNAISLGKSTRSLIRSDLELLDIGAIQEENSQAFYDNLGRRLACLRLFEYEKQQALCKALLTQCFKHGPKILDAAVILAATRSDLGEFITSRDHVNYVRKLDNDRDVKLAIEPLLAPFISN